MVETYHQHLANRTDKSNTPREKCHQHKQQPLFLLLLLAQCKSTTCRPAKLVPQNYGSGLKTSGSLKMMNVRSFFIAFGPLNVLISCSEDMFAALKPRNFILKDRTDFQLLTWRQQMGFWCGRKEHRKTSNILTSSDIARLCHLQTQRW